jgi:hypothetical protein
MNHIPKRIYEVLKPYPEAFSWIQGTAELKSGLKTGGVPVRYSRGQQD